MKREDLVTQSDMETLLRKLLKFLNQESTNKIKQMDFREITKNDSFYCYNKYDKILRCLSAEGLILVERGAGDIEPVAIVLNDAAYNYIQKKKRERCTSHLNKLWDVVKMIIAAFLGAGAAKIIEIVINASIE